MSDKKVYDILIVGCGASGLLSSILIKRNNPSFNVLVLEKLSECGKKLSITGKGRCNITNINAIGFSEVSDVLNDLGLELKIENEGRVYPKNMDAVGVRNHLFNLAKSLGVNFKFGFTVSEILKDDLFTVNGILAKKVIISTGGKSYPSLGTTGDGYVLSRVLGHTVKTLIPGLTGVKVAEDISYLKGIRQKGKATLIVNGKDYLSEVGEIQFKLNSISGICIMNLSNYIKKEDKCEIKLDFSEFARDKRIKEDEMMLNVTGLNGWKEAQVTIGGVSLDEVDNETFESKIVSNLYFTGEVLDYAYKCGGYNLNNAWYNAICLAKRI